MRGEINANEVLVLKMYYFSPAPGSEQPKKDSWLSTALKSTGIIPAMRRRYAGTAAMAEEVPKISSVLPDSVSEDTIQSHIRGTLPAMGRSMRATAAVQAALTPCWWRTRSSSCCPGRRSRMGDPQEWRGARCHSCCCCGSSPAQQQQVSTPTSIANLLPKQHSRLSSWACCKSACRCRSGLFTAMKECCAHSRICFAFL